MRGYTTKPNLSIMAWNIDGLSDKFEDDLFLQELSTHDICVLSETFLESNDFTPPPGFIYFNAFRSKKHKKARRGSGGVLVLVKKSIQKYVSKISVIKEHFIWIKISKDLTGHSGDTYCCCGYIPPQGTSFYKTNDIDLMEELDKSIISYSNLGYIFITGDYNARTGDKNDIVTLDDDTKNSNEISSEPQQIFKRNSRDKIVNTWGTKLLEICQNHNLCIVNGRTVGDFNGKFTFHSTLGNSSIDLAIVDVDYLPNILSFKVHPPNEFSHHCKIETKLSCLSKQTPIKANCISTTQFNRFTWQGDISRMKVRETVNSPTFIHAKQHILRKKYSTTMDSLNEALQDVEKLLTDLHLSSCKVKVVNKTKRKPNHRMHQPWYT